MPRITEMFAFIATEGPDDEGVPAYSVGQVMFPLVGADAARIRSLWQEAEAIGQLSGKRVRLVCFRQMVELGQAWPPDARSPVSA